MYREFFIQDSRNIKSQIRIKEYMLEKRQNQEIDNYTVNFSKKVLDLVSMLCYYLTCDKKAFYNEPLSYSPLRAGNAEAFRK